ncbi:tetratricopeptide repeat protein [Spirosoma oryzicola]|uniref:tetratricopeptide repeat protein n=1 Tax=Spirosoma oryzicola TaxID=2898794 RepID=UPI001E5E4DE0|nr:tetratricopeptide repeat protein [Spirosoma oryzicola]UHG93534.1 tetratricopeptide repeat protein [Spirosoma oryzicola]
MKNVLMLLLTLCAAQMPGHAQNAKNLTQAIQYIKLANTLREVDKSQESISLLQRAMPAVKSKNLYWEAITNELMGLSFKDIKDTTSALRYLELARSQYAKLKYVASGWAVNEVIRDISSKNVYAGIQVGAAGVKVAIFKTRYESDFYEKDIRSSFTIPTEVLVADASKSFKGGQDALRIGLDSIRRYNIPNERIFIVFNSDVNEGLTRSPESKLALYRQLMRVIPNGAVQIDTTLTPTREAQLFTVGAIPRKVWPTTSALNIGSANTMGGYFDKEASRKDINQVDKGFHALALPVGVNTLVNQIDSKRSLGMDAYKREAQRVVDNLANTDLKARLKEAGAGLQNHQTVGVGGDVALALVTYLYPDRSNVAAVAITTEDVERFKRLALTDYKALIQPDLADVTNPDVRSKAEKDVIALQSQFNEKQLIAGALWLEAIMKAYNTGSEPKRFVFVRNSDIGWVTGKFLETISGEYESTIAKGNLYTR